MFILCNLTNASDASCCSILRHLPLCNRMKTLRTFELYYTPRLGRYFLLLNLHVESFLEEGKTT